MHIVWTTYLILGGALISWVVFNQLRPGRPATPEEIEEGETAPDCNLEIGLIFRRLAYHLKRAGENGLSQDALFIAGKADGYGYRGIDVWNEEKEARGLSLYESALLLREIAKESDEKEAIREAARELSELNEKM